MKTNPLDEARSVLRKLEASARREALVVTKIKLRYEAKRVLIRDRASEAAQRVLEVVECNADVPGALPVKLKGGEPCAGEGETTPAESEERGAGVRTTPSMDAPAEPSDMTQIPEALLKPYTPRAVAAAMGETREAPKRRRSKAV